MRSGGRDPALDPSKYSVAGAAADASAKWWRVKHETERRLEESGIPHTSIRYAGLFIEAHCRLFLAEPVRDGRRLQMFAPPDNPVRWIAADHAAVSWACSRIGDLGRRPRA